MCQCHTAPTAREGIVDDSISGRTILIIQVVIYLYHLLQLFQDSIINPFSVERKIGNVCFLSVRHTLTTRGGVNGGSGGAPATPAPPTAVGSIELLL